MLVHRLKTARRSCPQAELLSSPACIRSFRRNDSLASSRISFGNLDEVAFVALQTGVSCKTQTLYNVLKYHQQHKVNSDQIKASLLIQNLVLHCWSRYKPCAGGAVRTSMHECLKSTMHHIKLACTCRHDTMIEAVTCPSNR